MTFLVLAVALVVLLIVGLPAAFALGVSSEIYLAVTRGIDSIPWSVLAQRTLYGLDNFSLLAIPLFLLVGRLMNESGMTQRLFGFANSLVGRWRGGLGQVTVLSGVIMAGMSGSAVADAAGLGSIAIKPMEEQGYDADFATGLVAGVSLIGPIIPPSVPAVLYAILAGTSVNAVLIAGIIPGLLMGLSFMIYVAIMARRRNYPVVPNLTWDKVWQGLRQGFLPLMTPVILIGGMLSGVFTATEAAAVASFYALIIAVFVYRSLSWKKVWAVLKKTTIDSSVVMFILGVSNIFTWILTGARIPQTLSSYIFGITHNYWLILLMVSGLLLFLGCFVSSIVSINLLTPIIVPLIVAAGGNAIHFGVFMILILMIGELTPPFGMVIFALMRVTGLSMARVVRAALPFYMPVFVVIIAIAVFPEIVTWLPQMLMH
ncbi:MAG: TRAP transporter large permease [Desulfitobacteriaceae bacterium]|nr:TRAP transporter large permease [Desulfitobacteriaceae bacterium]MDI6879075.1 TRAP transporter large permease [Desulfitobacteriaceae bacterium]MDI6913884.1 TRAP transporter large permease [Desulfitobacteriaceae bacterium]